MIISRWILLSMGNVTDESYKGSRNTHFVFSNFFFFWKTVPSVRQCRKNVIGRDRSQMSVKWRVRFVCWMTNVTDTHSEHVIIIAFLLQQWLHLRASMLRYTYIACLLVDCNTLHTQCTMLDRILTVTWLSLWYVSALNPFPTWKIDSEGHNTYPVSVGGRLKKKPWHYTAGEVLKMWRLTPCI